jgi:hypothetical protein
LLAGKGNFRIKTIQKNTHQRVSRYALTRAKRK